jgi:hypothetical protein
LLVIVRGDAVFEDGVEIGLDIVGVDDLVVLVFVFGGATLAGRGGRFFYFLFFLYERIGDLVVDKIVIDQVGFGVDVLELCLEVGLRVFVELL